jgi:hypothetical protein
MDLESTISILIQLAFTPSASSFKLIVIALARANPKPTAIWRLTRYDTNGVCRWSASTLYS